MSCTVQQCFLRVCAELISHKFEMSDCENTKQMFPMINKWCAFYSVISTVVCISALITVILCRAGAESSSANLSLFFGLFDGLSEIPSLFVQKHFSK